MKGLGKGLDNLIPVDFDKSLLHGSEKIEQIPLSKISNNPDQPRKHFDQTALEELSRSISRHGIVQPLVVTKNGDTYRIVAGERRFRAARIAKLQEVPAIVRSMKDLEELEISLIENVQRVDLSPLEQAVSIQKLHDQFSLGFDKIADRLGKATTTVHNIVRLLGLPNDAKDALNQGVISEGHARCILALKNPEQQKDLLEKIIAHKWSVRQAEQYVTAIKQASQPDMQSKTISERMASTNSETVKLGQKLDTKVTIKHMAKGGRLELHFKDGQQLEQIITKILS